MRFLTAALLAFAAAAAPTLRALPGRLLGLFQMDVDANDLTLYSISPNTGVNTSVGTGIKLGQLTETFPAASCFEALTSQLIVTCATADGVYALTASGSQSLVSPLPAYDDADPLAGLACTDDAIYYMTQTAVFTVGKGAAPVKVADVALSSTAVKVAVIPAGGTGGKPLLIVGDTGSSTWATLDAGNGFKQGTLRTSIAALWDLQYSALLGKLVAVAGYQLYTVDQSTGATKKVAQIVDGSGYPKVNAVDPTGRYFAFWDFNNVSVRRTGRGARCRRTNALISPCSVGSGWGGVGWGG